MGGPQPPLPSISSLQSFLLSKYLHHSLHFLLLTSNLAFIPQPQTLSKVRKALVHVGWAGTPDSHGKKLTFGGISMGASIGLRYAETYRDSPIDRIILVDNHVKIPE